jgi:hypothetical protein
MIVPIVAIVVVGVTLWILLVMAIVQFMRGASERDGGES